ncbi:MAG: alpha/beta hydrolase [Chloroflexota bacterium]
MLKIHETGQVGAPTIVFLHGLGISSWMWYEQVQALSHDFHCLAIDLPGNGESSGLPWISFADSARQIADVIRQQATGGVAHVVGLSLGGYTALYLLANHHDVVATMIASGVTTRPFPRPWLIRPLIRVAKHALKWDWVINLSAKALQLSPDVLPLYQRDSKRLSPQSIQRVYDEVLQIEFPASLAEACNPLLVVAGEKEARLVRDSLPDFPKVVETAVSAIVPNVHHGWNAEAPKLFTTMIRRWVTTQSLPDELKIISGGEYATISQ